MRRLAAALLLLSCTPAPQGVPCQTTCGMRLVGSNDCTGLKGAEMRATQVFAEHYPDFCDRLYGWNVVVQPKQNQQGTWLSPGGRMLPGLTFCPQRTIQVGTSDWPLSSFAHEAVHAAECGEVIIEKTEHAHSHWTWQEEAITRAR